jgi:toxin YoeB
MNLTFSPRAWYEYTGWQLEDKKILKRINLLIKDIERNGNTGIGKPEPLKGNRAGKWSVRIDSANRLVFSIEDGSLVIYSCAGHYE